MNAGPEASFLFGRGYFILKLENASFFARQLLKSSGKLQRKEREKLLIVASKRATAGQETPTSHHVILIPVLFKGV